MRRRNLLRRLGVLSALGLAGCETGGPTEPDGTDTQQDGTPGAGTPTAGGPGTPTAAEGPPRLQTEGAWIVTQDGERFTPRGVNVVEPLFGDRFAAARGGDYGDTLELATAVESAWYNRIVRVPVTQWGIDQLGFETYAERFVDPTVEHCRARNVYVILDYHVIRDWQDDEVHDQVREFWEFFAPRYADEPHLLYEFFNEPQNPADDTLENWEAWRERAQPHVDLIREQAPETPIVIGSPGWTSLTKWAPEAPFEGENLVYAGHVYPGDGSTAEAWEEDYGAPADEVPVLITEWGYDAIDDVQPGTTSGWGEPFREWLDGRENVGWTAWCLDSHWHPTMLDWDFNPTGGEQYHGWFVKRWLAETRDENVPEEVATEGAAFAGPDDDSPPPAPTNVDASGNDDGSVTLSWDQTVDEETRVAHYDVIVNDRVRDSVDCITLFNEAGGGEAFQAEDLRFETRLSGFTPGRSYDVQLTAIDSLSNESDRSEPVTHEPPGEFEIHAEIARLGSAPSIDGAVDDLWSDQTFHPFRHEVQGTVESEADLSGGWRAGWDDEALYVLVEVTDDAASSDSEAVWQDDSIEIYVDGDDSKLTDYDGRNDFQIQFPRDDRGVRGQLPNDLDDAAVAKTETDAGWRLEVALPWSALAPDQPVGAGHVVGFDVHVNDEDDGGERDGKLNWFNEQDDSWQNPSAFANVELVE